MKISVMITSRNRCEDLRRTLNILRGMDLQPNEILVTADGCTDGTVDMVKQEHPGCRLRINETSQGSIPSRDRMIREAEGDWVMSLDDDSYPLDTFFFSKLESLFIRHPEAAVICFPELCEDGLLHKADPLYSLGHYVPSYPNCAAVMRRDVYLKLRGFPAFFFHSYEEPDYAAQCYGMGLSVWFEPSLVIRHHYSLLNRDGFHIHLLNSRNELWSVWLNCPWPWLPLVSIFRIWRQFRYALCTSWRWILFEPLWWFEAIKGLPNCVRTRRAVPWKRYLAWMRLARKPIFNDSEFAKKFTN